MNTKSDSFVSVILVVERSSDPLCETLKQIQRHLDEQYSDYEIVIIAQGPLLDQHAGAQITAMLNQLVSVRYIQLATRVHTDIAWAAGLENAIGDFVVLFDYERDPIPVISDVVTTCKSGFDIVIGTAKERRTLAYRACRVFVERVLRAIDYQLPRNATQLRCLSRRTVTAVTSSARFHHQFHMRIQKTGYPACEFSYKLLSEKTKPRTLSQGIYDLIRLLVFNSTKPLRWMSGIGLVGSCSAFAFATYSLALHLVRNNIVEGWTTTILFMSMLFMFQFVMLAFFSEYLGRLLDERSKQANYAVVFEKTSAVMVNQDRVNVLGESVAPEPNRVQTGRKQ
jgi:hypothetical protein